jgi:hypothetical protein
MTNSNLIKVYGEGSLKYRRRQRYTDANGNTFSGTRTDALEHFRGLYPSMSIQISNSPRKREKR